MPKVELLICDNCGAEAARRKGACIDDWVLFGTPFNQVLCPPCWKRILVLAKPLVMKLVGKEPKLFAQWVKGTQFEQACLLLSEVFKALRADHVLGDD